MKILPNKQYPFFAEYHDASYIMSHDSRDTVVLRDKGHQPEYRLLNTCPKELVVYHIDEGLIKGNSVQKCDFGIYTEDERLFLVETKGSHLDEAIKQILSTIEKLFDKQSVTVKRIDARAVLSRVRVPKIISSHQQNLTNLLKKKYGGGTFDYKAQKMEEVL